MKPEPENRPVEAAGAAACRVFVVEDHGGLKQKLELLLEITDGMSCVGSACNGEEALEAILATEVDVVLVDLSLPVVSGLDVVREVTERQPQSKCLVISGFNRKDYVQSAMEAGARGFIAKGDPAEIPEAILAVHAGEVYFSEGLNPA